MKTKVIHKDAAPHYKWGRDCDSWVLADSNGLSVKQERMPPGTKEALHFHSVAQQFFFMLKGTARFYLEDNVHTLKEGEGVWVAPNEKHFIANETASDLQFLVISQPGTDSDRTVIATTTF